MATAVAARHVVHQPSPRTSHERELTASSGTDNTDNADPRRDASSEDSPAPRGMDDRGRPVLPRIRIPLALAVWQQYHDSTSTDSTSPVHIPPRKSRRKKRKKSKKKKKDDEGDNSVTNNKDGSGSQCPGTRGNVSADAPDGGAPTVAVAAPCANHSQAGDRRAARPSSGNGSIVNCVPGSDASAATLGKVVRRLSGSRKKAGGGSTARVARQASVEAGHEHAVPAAEGVAAAHAPGPVVRSQVPSASSAPIVANNSRSTRQRSDTVSSSQHGASGASSDGSAGRQEAEGRVSSPGRHSRVSSVSSFGSPAAALRCRVLCGERTFHTRVSPTTRVEDMSRELFADEVRQGNTVLFIFQGNVLDEGTVVAQEIARCRSRGVGTGSPRGNWSLVIHAVVQSTRSRSATQPNTNSWLRFPRLHLRGRANTADTVGIRGRAPPTVMAATTAAASWTRVAPTTLLLPLLALVLCGFWWLRTAIPHMFNNKSDAMLVGLTVAMAWACSSVLMPALALPGGGGGSDLWTLMQGCCDRRPRAPRRARPRIISTDATSNSDLQPGPADFDVDHELDGGSPLLRPY